MRFLINIYQLKAAIIFASLYVHAASYKHKEKVPVYVNKVYPYSNPHETYHYYQLPVCRPEKIIHRSLSLSEILNGDRFVESLYDIKYQDEITKTNICPPLKLDSDDLEQLKAAIEENYFFEFMIDDLTIKNFVGRLDEEGIFPHTHKVYLYTHHHFVIEFNGENIISAKLEVDKETPIRLDDKDSPLEVTFTYSVKWISTRVEYKDRQKAAEDSDFPPKSLEIHWLSVLNSSLLVLLLVGFVSIIVIRVVRRDLTRYGSNISDHDSDEKFDELDTGWKVLHSDVFRFPKFRNVLCSIIGVGTQFLAIITSVLLICSLNLINVHRHGLINTVCVVLYALTSGIAGYVSSSWYHKLGGTQWVWNINLTSALFALPAFIVWAIENSIFWAYNSTQALPFTTIILLSLIWICIGYPLTVVGGVMGKNLSSTLDAPCRTKNIPRELPHLDWYYSPVVFGIIGGFLPFSAISVELYYIYATIWAHETYTIFNVLLIVFCLLLIVTACVSITLIYFQLTAEDYRWWWRSILIGGSTSVFVLFYSLFFYFYRSELSGILQTVEYFGYIVLICYVFFLSLSTVSFLAANKFIRYIYSSVKTD